MNKKNNNPKRTFIPQPIGNTIKKVNRNFTSKYGKIEFIIQSKWSDIAGKYFAEYSEPKNITRLLDSENEIGEQIYKNYLNVSVAPAAALEFQHFRDTILEKINSYFGFKAVLDLRIQQNYIPKYNTMKKAKSMQINKDDKEFIEKNIEEFQNNELKKSLLNLGNKITIEDK